MSRRNPSLTEVLVLLPWQVSATLGVAVYVTLRWVLPNIETHNPVFGAMFQAAAGLAWFALLFFGAMAGVSALMAAKKRAILDQQRDLESLNALSWHKFEWLVGEAYRRQGYAVEESMAAGADGGIDLVLRKGGQTVLVQCKRWKVQAVGVPIIREMFGLLTHHGASRVIVVSSGRFTREAVSFAAGKPIELVDGPALLELVRSVQKPGVADEAPQSLPESPGAVGTGASAVISPLDPADGVVCPSCGAAMVRRVAKRGTNAGNAFWGCSTYPRCRGVRG